MRVECSSCTYTRRGSPVNHACDPPPPPTHDPHRPSEVRAPDTQSADMHRLSARMSLSRVKRTDTRWYIASVFAAAAAAAPSRSRTAAAVSLTERELPAAPAVPVTLPVAVPRVSTQLAEKNSR